MRRIAALLVVLVLAAGCTSDSSDQPEAQGSATPTEASTGSTSEAPAPSESPAPAPAEAALPEVHHPLSLPALMREPPSGGKPRILRTEYETADYTRLRRHLPQ